MAQNCYNVFHQRNKTICKEEGVQDVANLNKTKFEAYGSLVDQVFWQFNENLINNQDQQSQIKNNETLGAEYPNQNDSDDTETNKTSAVPNFMPNTSPDDEIPKGKIP